MAFGSAMGVQEAAVSSETAISCLILLSTQFGGHVDIENVRPRQQFRGATLSISELIGLVNDFGFRAEYIRRDWPWLHLAVTSQPTLLLLKNGNTIVAVGTGRTGAEEIVVCDPLHRGGIPIILSRENIERAWDGDTVDILRNDFTNEKIDPNIDVIITEKLSNTTRTTQQFWRRLGDVILFLGSIVLVLTLNTSPIAESPVISRRPDSAMPAIAPLHKSSFANGTGHQHTSGQSADASLPLSPESPPGREGSGLSGDVTLSASDVAALLARGDDQLRLGDFTSARLFYEIAADAGEANAALRLGETFDPIFIDRTNLRGVRANMERAVFWYIRARDLGSSAAEKLLKNLLPN
jgi:hypothetical protein